MVLLLGFDTVFSMDDHVIDALPCSNPACNRVAERIEYKYVKPVSSVTLKTGHFSIEIPDKPIAKIVSSKEDLMILYRDDQLLYISETSGPKIANLEPDLAYQYPEIVFLKTTKDTVPEADKAKLFWKTALASKQFYFQGASEVFYSENRDLTYYLSNTHELGFSARAMVSSSRYKHLFLIIEAKQVGFDTFKQIVSSVN
jgi:hypothetical protein